MSRFEDQLLTSAEVLDETKDLAAIVLDILAGAAGAGIARPAVVPLQLAARKLDPAGGIPDYNAGGRFDRSPGTGFESDDEFLEAVHGAWAKVRKRLQEVTLVVREVTEAVEQAEYGLQRYRQDLQAAHVALAAALARPTREPCDGCHRLKQAAIAGAEQRIAAAEQGIHDDNRRLGVLHATGEILNALTSRLGEAAKALRQVPSALGEEYELAYAYIEGGGKLPKLARFLTGQGAPPR
jgi:hypothetical protein